MRLAFQRGETDIYATSNSLALKELMAEGFQPFVQKGRLMPDGSFKKRAEFPKVPLFDELLGARKPAGVPWQAYTILAGSDDAGRPLHVGQKTPPEIVRAYRESFRRLEAGKEFKAELARIAAMTPSCWTRTRPIRWCAGCSRLSRRPRNSPVAS
jgi:hypothetical protein